MTQTMAPVVIDREEIDLLVRQMLNIGEAMYCAGAEISRIERTLYLMGKAYGAAHVNIYAITSSIVVTVEFESCHVVTQTRRIHRYTYDLTRLERLYSLCRECIARPMAVQELQSRVLDILDTQPNERRTLLGGILAASAFAVFFGGGAWDALAAGAAAVLVHLLGKYVRPLCSGRVYFNVITAFVTGAAILLIGKLHPALRPDQITIGVIMLLIPGSGVTNAIRYILSGNSISGWEKLVECLLQTAGLAAGFTLALYLFG